MKRIHNKHTETHQKQNERRDDVKASKGIKIHNERINDRAIANSVNN